MILIGLHSVTSQQWNKQQSFSLNPSTLARIHTHTHIHARTRIHTHTHARTHIHTHARMHAHTHTHVRTHGHTHICMHTRTHARTHARSHTQTHTNTHTRLWGWTWLFWLILLIGFADYHTDLCTACRAAFGRGSLCLRHYWQPSDTLVIAVYLWLITGSWVVCK